MPLFLGPLLVFSFHNNKKKKKEIKKWKVVRKWKV
jgi:hypothetical protein